MSLPDFVYNQLSGFAKAGQKMKPAENTAELIISKIIAAALLALMGAIIYFSITLDYLSWSTRAKALFTLLLLIPFTWRFYRGVSIVWIIKGMFKYWLATLLLIILFASLTYIAVGVISGNIKEEELIFIAGVLIFLVGFFLAIAFLHGAKKSETTAKRSGSIFMIFFWICFIIGGIIAIAVGLGF